MKRHVCYLFVIIYIFKLGFPGGSDGKESACNAGDLGLIPGLGRSLGKGHGNPLQYSFLENPHGQRSLVGYSPWGCQESDMTEQLSTEHIYKSHTSNSLYPTLVNSGTKKCLCFLGSHYLGEEVDNYTTRERSCYKRLNKISRRGFLW